MGQGARVAGKASRCRLNAQEAAAAARASTEVHWTWYKMCYMNRLRVQAGKMAVYGASAAVLRAEVHAAAPAVTIVQARLAFSPPTTLAAATGRTGCSGGQRGVRGGAGRPIADLWGMQASQNPLEGLVAGRHQMYGSHL